MNENATPEGADELHAHLASIEQLLESPIVPGEMRGWFEEIRDQFTRLAQAYDAHRRDAHQAQYDQIEEADAALLARIDQLEQDDALIADEIERLRLSFADATKAVETAEELPQSDEAELSGAVPPLVADALALVIRIRMQEKAVATWFVEAFQRDRGVAD